MRIEEKEYTKSIDISIWKKVFPFLAPRKNVLIMVIVMNILCSVVDIIMPLFQRQAIDSFIEKNTLAGIGGFIALYIAVNDVARITELIAWDVIDMLWAIFYVVGVFVAMLFLNWKLALVIMLIVPAIAVLTW